MYPFDFKPTADWIDNELIFVAMPLAKQYKNIYKLIKQSVEIIKDELNQEFKVWRADEDVATQVGWAKILDKIMTSRLCIGVLTGHNPNVYYELGIAHATQQIERQILLVPDSSDYLSKFDLQHLTYVSYDKNNPLESVDNLAKKIEDKIAIYNYNKDKKLEQTISKISLYEYDLLKQIGLDSHIGKLEVFADDPDKIHVFLAYRDLSKFGILRLSINCEKGESSYYFTELGNAVLHALGIITFEEMERRNRSYRRNQKNHLFSVYNKK